MTLQQDQNNEYMADTKQKIIGIIENNITEWFDIINSLGFDSQHYRSWCEQFVEEISDVTTECVTSVAEKRDDLLKKIELLLQTCQQMCRQLGIKLPQFESSAEGLYHDEANLIKHILTWQEEIDKRKAEIAKIKDERNDLCSQLSVIPFEIKEYPLPTENELEYYKQKIGEMKMEMNARLENTQKLYHQIKLITEKIHYKPRTLFEQDIVSRNNNSEINITEEHIHQLTSFHNEITNKYESIKVDTKVLIEQLKDLWKIIGEDSSYCNNFIENHCECNLSNLEEIKIELLRCQELRRNTLKQLIDARRIELMRLWDLAGYTNEQREYYNSIFNDEFYTEDLLEMHEFAIKHMREYLKKVEDMLELLRMREELYEQMQVLVQNSQDPNRYKNRGGKLLREEKARKAAVKNISIIEKRLEKLSARYETNHGTPFLYNGHPISNLISSSHENITQVKRSEPVTKMYRSPSPRRTGITPHARSRSKSPLKLVTTVSLKWPVGSRSAPKIKGSYSGEKKKRMHASRILKTTSLSVTDDVNYSKFKNDLADTKAPRSTMCMNSPNSNKLHASNVLTTPPSTNSYLDIPRKLKF